MSWSNDGNGRYPLRLPLLARSPYPGPSIHLEETMKTIQIPPVSVAVGIGLAGLAAF